MTLDSLIDLLERLKDLSDNIGKDVGNLPVKWDEKVHITDVALVEKAENKFIVSIY